MSDDDRKTEVHDVLGIGSGIGCLSMCALAGFIFWMCTGFMGCHNTGGWFRNPVDVHVTKVEAAK